MERDYVTYEALDAVLLMHLEATQVLLREVEEGGGGGFHHG
jgi:hypothetical protein